MERNARYIEGVGARKEREYVYGNSRSSQDNALLLYWGVLPMLNCSFPFLIPEAIWKAAAITWREDSDWKGSKYDYNDEDESEDDDQKQLGYC